MLSGRFGVGPWLRNSAWTWLPPSWPQSLAVSTTAEAAEAAAEPDVGWTLNVKSPRSPWKPEITKVYVPATVNVRLMSSGLVPVSTVVQRGAAGVLERQDEVGLTGRDRVHGRADGLTRGAR